jgi:hypothetical protein
MILWNLDIVKGTNPRVRPLKEPYRLIGLRKML